MYADDTTLLASLESLLHDTSDTDSAWRINSELDNICNWLSVNMLSQNVNKTKHMLFHFPQRTIDYVLPIKMNNVVVQKVTEFNFLGTIVHETLSWSSHVNHICNKLSRTVGILKFVSKYASRRILTLLYNSLFASHVNYSLLLWGFSNERIYLLQKKAVRIICKQKYNAHSEPLFKQLNLLKVDDLFYLNALKFYHKYLHDELPAYFKDMFNPLTVSHDHYTRHRDVPQYGQSNKISTSKCIRYHIPSILKELDHVTIDRLNNFSLKAFSNFVKTSILSRYDFICTDRQCFVCN